MLPGVQVSVTGTRRRTASIRYRGPDRTFRPGPTDQTASASGGSGGKRSGSSLKSLSALSQNRRPDLPGGIGNHHEPSARTCRAFRP